MKRALTVLTILCAIDVDRDRTMFLLTVGMLEEHGAAPADWRGYARRLMSDLILRELAGGMCRRHRERPIESMRLWH